MENKSCENCGAGHVECATDFGKNYCAEWQEKSADPRGENYHKPPEIEDAAEKRGAEKERVRIVKMLSTTPDGFSEDKYDGWREALACIIRSDKKLDEIYNSCRVAAAFKRGAEKEREAWNRTLMYLASLFGGGYSKDDIVPQILRLKKQSIMANKYRTKNKEQKIQITNLLRKLKNYEEGK